MLEFYICWERQGMEQRLVSDAGERRRANGCELNGGIIAEFAWRDSG
jgi:hypothetical protein